jgi:hypothetical protein
MSYGPSSPTGSVLSRTYGYRRASLMRASTQRMTSPAARMLYRSIYEGIGDATAKLWINGAWKQIALIPPSASGLATFVQNSGDGVTAESTFNGYTLEQWIQLLYDMGLRP